MKLRLLLSASLFMMLFSVKSFAQDKNCDVKQLQAETYDFTLKNLDSIKKYVKSAQITAAFEMTEKGEVKNIDYYLAYGAKEQKKVKVWKGLETFVKETFSRCTDSHFYNGREQVLKADFSIPLSKEEIIKAKNTLEATPGYTAPGYGLRDVPKDSKYTLEIKSFAVGQKTNEPLIKEGTMDYDRSKMIRLSEIFHMAFDVVKPEGSKTTYVKYKLYERVDNKGRIITSEEWRPVVDGKANLSVKGIRDTYPGVQHMKVGEEFDFDIQITFHN
jgi:hypothetical protein